MFVSVFGTVHLWGSARKGPCVFLRRVSSLCCFCLVLMLICGTVCMYVHLLVCASGSSCLMSESVGSVGWGSWSPSASPRALMASPPCSPPWCWASSLGSPLACPGGIREVSVSGSVFLWACVSLSEVGVFVGGGVSVCVCWGLCRPPVSTSVQLHIGLAGPGHRSAGWICGSLPNFCPPLFCSCSRKAMPSP